MTRAIYIGNCLASISGALEKLPPNRWYQTWQEVGAIVAMESVHERHARLLQLSEILTESVQKAQTSNLPK